MENNLNTIKAENVSIPKDLYDYFIFLGIIRDNSDVRKYNIGKSNYTSHIIQPWTIWLDYPELNSFDCDIIKRVLRTKVEDDENEIQARIKEYKKIIHICEERIRQLTCDWKNNG